MRKVEYLLCLLWFLNRLSPLDWDTLFLLSEVVSAFHEMSFVLVHEYGSHELLVFLFSSSCLWLCCFFVVTTCSQVMHSIPIGYEVSSHFSSRW